ncbi:Hypp6727 [Branchiostoma lanceolatum]|uniref:Hypp6727 protein n=1 Tax=Branchiostoma lanceolatum TaxID=7740 RepID=A0A8K0E5J9_BRALA|nr:Hypp6727 [Branchiostoma lanceolatum]
MMSMSSSCISSGQRSLRATREASRAARAVSRAVRAVSRVARAVSRERIQCKIDISKVEGSDSDAHTSSYPKPKSQVWVVDSKDSTPPLYLQCWERSFGGFFAKRVKRDLRNPVNDLPANPFAGFLKRKERSFEFHHFQNQKYLTELAVAQLDMGTVYTELTDATKADLALLRGPSIARSCWRSSAGRPTQDHGTRLKAFPVYAADVQRKAKRSIQSPITPVSQKSRVRKKIRFGTPVKSDDVGVDLFEFDEVSRTKEKETQTSAGDVRDGMDADSTALVDEAVQEMIDLLPKVTADTGLWADIWSAAVSQYGGSNPVKPTHLTPESKSLKQMLKEKAETVEFLAHSDSCEICFDKNTVDHTYSARKPANKRGRKRKVDRRAGPGGKKSTGGDHGGTTQRQQPHRPSQANEGKLTCSVVTSVCQVQHAEKMELQGRQDLAPASWGNYLEKAQESEEIKELLRGCIKTSVTSEEIHRCEVRKLVHERLTKVVNEQQLEGGQFIDYVDKQVEEQERKKNIKNCAACGTEVPKSKRICPNTECQANLKQAEEVATRRVMFGTMLLQPVEKYSYRPKEREVQIIVQNDKTTTFKEDTTVITTDEYADIQSFHPVTPPPITMSDPVFVNPNSAAAMKKVLRHVGKWQTSRSTAVELRPTVPGSG